MYLLGGGAGEMTLLQREFLQAGVSALAYARFLILPDSLPLSPPTPPYVSRYCSDSPPPPPCNEFLPALHAVYFLSHANDLQQLHLDGPTAHASQYDSELDHSRGWGGGL